MWLGVALAFLVAGTALATDTTPTPAKEKPAPAGKIGTTATEKPATAAKPAAKPAVKPAPKGGVDEVAILETSKGKMVIEFWEKEAPQTVANFKKLARQGYYDGTGFHRIIKNFMIQGGDPNSKNPSAPNLGTGGPGYTIKDEFNSHKHVKGVLSMANTGTPNSAGSQFFVMHAPAVSLDGHYTGFGHLLAGMDVLDKIANSPCGPNPSMPGENSKPQEWTTIKSAKIMSKAAYMAGTPGAKAEASKPAAKPAEMKAGMGAGTGMDMKAEETKAPEAKATATKAAEEPKDKAGTEPPAAPEGQSGK
jgi:peptidyl-prolyl cis-trans isomerase B (cyclophilin B)